MVQSIHTSTVHWTLPPAAPAPTPRRCEPGAASAIVRPRDVYDAAPGTVPFDRYLEAQNRIAQAARTAMQHASRHAAATESPSATAATATPTAGPNDASTPVPPQPVSTPPPPPPVAIERVREVYRAAPDRAPTGRLIDALM